MENKLYMQGAAARREIGDQTDDELLETITHHPGLTMYELAKMLEWSFGRTHGSIQRLKEEKKLITRMARKGGKLAHLVFPFQAAGENLGEITIDRKLLEDPAKWEIATAYAYCLTRETIGFSPEENAHWKEVSISEDRVHVDRNQNQFIISLSKRLQDFYMTGNTELDIASSGDRIIVSFLETFLPISGNIAEINELESQIEGETARTMQRSLYGYQRGIWHSAQKNVIMDFKLYKDDKYAERIGFERIRYPILESINMAKRNKVKILGRSQ